MCAKPTKPRWADGHVDYTTEPSSGKKDTGWLSGEKPPFQYMNWLFLQNNEWIDYLEGQVDGAVGITGLGLFNATTTDTNDSIVIKKHDGTDLSSTNKGYVRIPDSSGNIDEYEVTANVTIKLTGAHWGFGGGGDVSNIHLSVYAVNDNDASLKWGITVRSMYPAGQSTSSSTTQTSIVGTVWMLVNSALTAGTAWQTTKFGTFSADFDDTGGASEDLWAVDTGSFSLKTGDVDKWASQSSGGIAVWSGCKVYLDGGDDTYITETSANKMDFFCSGSKMLSLNQAVQVEVSSGMDFVMSSTQKLYLDGGTDTYIVEEVGNRFYFYGAGNLVGNISNVGTTFFNTTGSANPFGVESSNVNGFAFRVSNSSASFASTMHKILSNRSSSSTAYNFIGCESGSGDNELIIRGDGRIASDVGSITSPADYGEFFESSDGLALEVGRTVIIDNGKVRVATGAEQPDGVVRPKKDAVACSVVANSAALKWDKKYLKDEFGRFEMENYEIWSWTEKVPYDSFQEDENGNHVLDESGEKIPEVKYNDRVHSYMSDAIPDGVIVPVTGEAEGEKNVVIEQRKKLNPAFDPEQEYVAREDRDEWNLIGLLGQVPIKKGEPMNDAWKLMDDSGVEADIYFIK